LRLAVVGAADGAGWGFAIRSRAFDLNRAVSFQPPASSGGKSATWRILFLSAVSGSPLGEESNAGKQCQDKALSWLLVAGSSF
jgi:hypothetical protein